MTKPGDKPWPPWPPTGAPMAEFDARLTMASQIVTENGLDPCHTLRISWLIAADERIGRSAEDRLQRVLAIPGIEPTGRG